MKPTKLENWVPKTQKRSTQNSKTKHPKLKKKAPKHWKRSTQNLKTEHPKLENGAPKSRKQSTQKSKTKHPKLETCLSFKNTRQSLVKSPAAGIKPIMNRMQFKTIQVELWGVANAFPSPWLLAISELRSALGQVSDLNSINWHHHVKGHVEIGYLTKFEQVSSCDSWHMVKYPYKRL